MQYLQKKKKKDSPLASAALSYSKLQRLRQKCHTLLMKTAIFRIPVQYKTGFQKIQEFNLGNKLIAIFLTPILRL